MIWCCVGLRQQGLLELACAGSLRWVAPKKCAWERAEHGAWPSPGGCASAETALEQSLLHDNWARRVLLLR